jgi:hypothetical protein
VAATRETFTRVARARCVARACAILLLAGAAVARAQATPPATRVTLSGALAGWHVFRLDGDTPSERPSTTLDLRFEAERGDVAQFVTHVRAGYDGKVGDPDERDRPILTLDEVYQDKDLFVDFEEAYLDLFLGAFEARIGKQKIAWGQLDEVQPTDNLNPEDLTEFFFRPEQERKIGIPAVTVAGYRGPWTLEAVWAPFYTALRFPHRRDRWFPPLLRVPARFDTPLGTLPIRTRYPDVDPPPHTLASSDVGVRLRRFVAGAELSVSVFHGWDKTPTFAGRGTVTVTPTGDPAQPAAPNVDFAIVPSLHRITVVGGDLAVPIWLLALRAEAAWIHGRFFPLSIRDRIGSDPDLVATVAETTARVAASGRAETVPLPIPAVELEREAAQYGVGVDLNVNEPLSRALVGGEQLAGTFLLLQLIESVIFTHDRPFIADQIEHLLGFTMRRAFLRDSLLTQVKVAYNPNHGDLYVWPQLAYKLTPTLHALFEARVIAGSRSHEIGQYRDLDGILIGLRRFF